MKSIILICIIFCAAFSQPISLKGLITQLGNSSLKQNCVKVDQQDCIQCAVGYYQSDGDCFKGVQVQDNPQNEQCAVKDQCGDAQAFKSQEQVKKFVEKYSENNIGRQSPIISIQPAVLINQVSIDTTQVTDQVIAKPSTIRQAAAAAASTIKFAAATQFSAAPAQARPQTQALVRPPPQQQAQTFRSQSLPTVAADRDFSTTNNQVQGVDEADIIKTDGTYIYSISNQILSIILAYPAKNAKIVSKIDLTGFNPASIFIDGNYLAVFGVKTTYYFQEGGFEATFARISRPYRYSESYTYIKIYNIRNKATPVLFKEYKVCGNYFNGRKLDNGFMYLITTYSPFYIKNPLPWFDIGLGQRFLPFSDIFFFPNKYQQPSAVTIISFNLGNPKKSIFKAKTFFCEYASIMYMSQSYIYLTFTSWQTGQSLTHIKKIYVNQNYIRPDSNTQVSGTVLNQFSMDEFGRYFRVATTSNKNGALSNNVFVLGNKLKLVGSLTGIAPGETIRSARYSEKRLYLVTFRQVDPFFVISFKDPKKPVILGQLKITGFSSYLHLYDEQTVIGIGRQADTNGRTQGLKISLFDVSNVKKPVQAAKFQLQQTYASSIAEYEHKAFLLSQDKNLMVIPGSMNQQGDSGVRFNGAFAFKITPSSIDLEGLIDHLLSDSDDFYKRSVERSLYIEDVLYTKSQCLLKLNKIDSAYTGINTVNLDC